MLRSLLVQSRSRWATEYDAGTGRGFEPVGSGLLVEHSGDPDLAVLHGSDALYGGAVGHAAPLAALAGGFAHLDGNGGPIGRVIFFSDRHGVGVLCVFIYRGSEIFDTFEIFPVTC